MGNIGVCNMKGNNIGIRTIVGSNNGLYLVSEHVFL